MDGHTERNEWRQIEMRRREEEKKRGWGGRGPLQSNHHILSLVRDIIYTNPLKGQEQSMRCQLQLGSQRIFSCSFRRSLFRFMPIFVRPSLLSVRPSVQSFSYVLMGLSPITVDLRVRRYLCVVCVCYSKTACLRAILVFVACVVRRQRCSTRTPIFIRVKTQKLLPSMYFDKHLDELH